MRTNDKIYVAGHRGLAGSAIVRELRERGYANIVTRSHGELDLTDQARVRTFFDEQRPDYVFLAAAKVGGIRSNDTYRADFIYQNLTIQSNVISSACNVGVKKLLFLGSSCIYPKHAPQPISEDYLLDGKLEPTNQPYAIAKIAGIEMCDAYNRQYRTNYLCAMPTNLFGPGDNYDLENSHVLPALLRKAHEAKVRDEPFMTVWGTGTPRREFLYSNDLADACVFLMENHDAAGIGKFINVGTGADYSIAELARSVADIVGYRGEFFFDTSRPDGTPRKLLDVSRMRALGWRARTELTSGLATAYADYLSRFAHRFGVPEALTA